MRRIALLTLPLLAVVLVLVLVACGSEAIPTLSSTEREAIVAFTRQALAIEARRAELMQYFATARTNLGVFAQRTIIEHSFYLGVRPGAYKYAPLSGLEGMGALQDRLLLLSAPQSLQPVKDALVTIYNSEIQLHQAQRQSDELYAEWQSASLFDPSIPAYYPLPETFIWPEVTKDNISYWEQLAGSETVSAQDYQRLLGSQWVQLQKLRRDTYVRWSDTLKQYGVDAQKHGLAGLATSGASAISPEPALLVDVSADYGSSYLQIYFETLGLRAGSFAKTPEERYLENLAPQLLTVFQIQQKIGAVPGNPSGVANWRDYLQSFIASGISGGRWREEQIKTLLSTLMNTPLEQRRWIGYAYDEEGARLDAMVNLLRLLYLGHGSTMGSFYADKLVEAHRMWLILRRSDPVHTPVDFFDYVTQLYPGDFAKFKPNPLAPLPSAPTPDFQPLKPRTREETEEFLRTLQTPVPAGVR